MAINQFSFVHGLGESQSSDWAGTDSLAKYLQTIYPNDEFNEYVESDFDTQHVPYLAGKQIGIGNSYGVSALIRHADLNPQETWDLIIMLDGVPRLDKKPRQYSCTEWKRRPNIKRVVSFKENVSILGLMTGTCRDAAQGEYDKTLKATKRAGPWFAEYLLDRDTYNPVSDFLAHFTLETQHAWVKEIILHEIALTVAAT